jgi:hypothetical protein
MYVCVCMREYVCAYGEHNAIIEPLSYSDTHMHTHHYTALHCTPTSLLLRSGDRPSKASTKAELNLACVCVCVCMYIFMHMGICVYVQQTLHTHTHAHTHTSRCSSRLALHTTHTHTHTLSLSHTHTDSLSLTHTHTRTSRCSSSGLWCLLWSTIGEPYTSSSNLASRIMSPILCFKSGCVCVCV